MKSAGGSPGLRFDFSHDALPERRENGLIPAREIEEPGAKAPVDLGGHRGAVDAPRPLVAALAIPDPQCFAMTRKQEQAPAHRVREFHTCRVLMDHESPACMALSMERFFFASLTTQKRARRLDPHEPEFSKGMKRRTEDYPHGPTTTKLHSNGELHGVGKPRPAFPARRIL
jgi:hypothetical protein